MQRNSHLIDKSDLLAIIVKKIETIYSEDISLLICYGSFVTGEYGVMSDIDFFFVPKTNRGYELNYQFIINNIGYDLWAVSWERLKRISNFEDPLTSILMDGKVIFASTEEDLQKLQNLKNNLRQNLNNEVFVGKMSSKYIEKAKINYFNLQNHESNTFQIDTVKIADTLLNAIAILNNTYLKKGLKQIENELDRMLLTPVGFLENYRKLIKIKNKDKVQYLINEMIIETEKIYRSKFDQVNVNVKPTDLTGFYEEFKSAYNKLLLACNEKDYENAYYAGYMIDRETQFFLIHHTNPGVFPNMIDEVLTNNFESIRAKCIEHERQLINLLNQNSIEINDYKDCSAFREHFLDETT
jgi:predicted nucleotidyltransferase